MGTLFSFHRRAGGYFSGQCFVFSPVPGLFFGQQPFCGNTSGVGDVRRDTFFITAEDPVCISIYSLYAGKNNHYNEQGAGLYRKCPLFGY